MRCIFVNCRKNERYLYYVCITSTIGLYEKNMTRSERQDVCKPDSQVICSGVGLILTETLKLTKGNTSNYTSIGRFHWYTCRFVCLDGVVKAVSQNRLTRMLGKPSVTVGRLKPTPLWVSGSIAPRLLPTLIWSDLSPDNADKAQGRFRTSRAFEFRLVPGPQH